MIDKHSNSCLTSQLFSGKDILTQNRHFCARGWLPRVQQCPLKPSRAHRSSAPPATCPAGVHLAAVRPAIDCRNPLPSAPTAWPGRNVIGWTFTIYGTFVSKNLVSWRPQLEARGRLQKPNSRGRLQETNCRGQLQKTNSKK